MGSNYNCPAICRLSRLAATGPIAVKCTASSICPRPASRTGRSPPFGSPNTWPTASASPMQVGKDMSRQTTSAGNWRSGQCCTKLGRLELAPLLSSTWPLLKLASRSIVEPEVVLNPPVLPPDNLAQYGHFRIVALDGSQPRAHIDLEPRYHRILSPIEVLIKAAKRKVVSVNCTCSIAGITADTIDPTPRLKFATSRNFAAWQPANRPHRKKTNLPTSPVCGFASSNTSKFTSWSHTRFFKCAVLTSMKSNFLRLPLLF